jgi:hypothetical protein
MVMTDTADHHSQHADENGRSMVEWNARRFTIHYESIGVFNYGTTGFAVLSPAGHTKYAYADIEVIVAFKVKRPMGDELRVEIIFNDCAIRISQEAPGWQQFVVKTREVFPTIPEHWDLEMLTPSFAIDLMVLYKKPEA